MIWVTGEKFCAAPPEWIENLTPVSSPFESISGPVTTALLESIVYPGPISWYRKPCSASGIQSVWMLTVSGQTPFRAPDPEPALSSSSPPHAAMTNVAPSASAATVVLRRRCCMVAPCCCDQLLTLVLGAPRGSMVGRNGGRRAPESSRRAAGRLVPLADDGLAEQSEQEE